MQTRSYADGSAPKAVCPPSPSVRGWGGDIIIISFGQKGLGSQDPDQTTECSLRAVRSGSTQLELCDQDPFATLATTVSQNQTGHQGIHCLPLLLHSVDILLKGNRSTLFKMITVH